MDSDFLTRPLLDHPLYSVFDKPAGIVVHPASTITEDTPILTEMVAKDFPQYVLETGSVGLVHRLDKETSGVLILAKSLESFTFFRELFAQRRIQKYYLALTHHKPQQKHGIVETGIIRDPKDPVRRAVCHKDEGKFAKTEYVCRAYASQTQAALVWFQIFTGRTHQIRVHARYIGCPILGDGLYGTKASNELSTLYNIHRHLLHASTLRFVDMDGISREVLAPLPADFKEAGQVLFPRS